MNTLPGLASKAEKGKSKYQSLDINSLYRVSRGESLEPHQQKNTLPRKHGMQSLGKVPSARRPPANLPSLKSEHSGSDAAVSLVPSGGPGWGKQDSSTSTSTATTPSSTPTNSVASTTPPITNVTASVQVTSNNIVQPATSPSVQQQQQQQQQQPQQQQQQQQQQAPPPQQQQQSPPTVPPPSSTCPPLAVPPAVASDNKSWSAVMSGTDILGQHPPPYQSPQFQHEFPSLSASGADGPALAGGVTQRDVQYGPGPSLRPQTEGSWMQGGSRATQVAGAEQPVAKTNSAPLAGPPQLLGPAGPVPPAGVAGVPAAHQHMLQQFRGVAPPFMFRGNFPPPANGAVSNFSAITNPLTGRGPPGRFPAPGAGPNSSGTTGSFPPEQRPPQPASTRNNANQQPSTELDEVTPRPIIKEEDLNRMDDMTRDVGWASHDDIDYNQKLAFSDDDLSADRDIRKEHIPKKEQDRIDGSSALLSTQDNRNSVSNSSNPNATAARGWATARLSGNNSQPATPQTARGGQVLRPIEDEEVWNQRRRQHSEEVAIAVERAKLRKEEEEKRYMELKQAAAKKLQKLEEKMKEKKVVDNTKENEEGQGTINPSAVPPQPITPVPIPVPDWERDRENRERERSRTPNDTSDSKASHTQAHRENDFRQMTQIEGRSFINKNSRSSEREISRERDIRDRDRDTRDRAGPFSHFQSNLPPRFQKQQAERQGSNAPYHRNGNSNNSQPQQANTATTNVPFAQQYEPRWVQTSSSFPSKSSSGSMARKNRSDADSNFDRERDRDRDRDQRERDEERRDMRRHGSSDVGRHSSGSERDRERSYPESIRKISGGDSYDDYRNYRRENSQEYEFKRDRDEDKWEKDRERHYDDRKDDIKKSAVQQDPFDEHELSKQEGDWHRDGKYSKENWEERPLDRHREEISQRPDSRDSRISKDSNRDLDYSGNWADTPFEPSFTEEKKKDSYREERRQVPGPITKEKIEADDLKNEKRHLTQLKRMDPKDKKSDDKIIEKKSDDAWSLRKKDDTATSSKAWADSISPIVQSSDNSKFMEALEKGNKKSSSGDLLHKSDTKNDTKKSDKDIDLSREKDDKHSQGGSSRVRPDSSRNHRNNQWQGGYSVYGSSWSKRGDPRSGVGRGPQRSGHRNRDWHATDSELSGDEVSVSTESGKEERMGRHGQPQRSPKPTKKSDKDEKNKDLKQDKVSDRDRDRDRGKYDKRSYEPNSRNNRETFVPRGEPSRHGRGGFRGTRSITSKRIDGYGIPPSKSPFGNQHEDKEKKLSGDEIGGEVVSSDEKTKLNQQQALSAGIIGSSRNPSKNECLSRSQRKSDIDKHDGSKVRTHSGSRRQKPKNKLHNSDAGEECWETTSENSDTENERKDKGRKKPTGRMNQNSSYVPGSLSRQSSGSSGLNSMSNRSNNQSNRNSSDKRSNNNFNNRNEPHSGSRQNSGSNLRSHQNSGLKLTCKEVGKDDKNDSIISLENKSSKDIKSIDCNDIKIDDDIGNEEKPHFDADGFQEVRSKKNVKERQKIDEKPTSRSNNKSEKESLLRGQKPKGNSPAAQLTPQQIASIPPLLGTPVNPPNMMNTGSNKLSFERPRQKLPPRLAKQRENNRLQKAQMQQNMCDVNEMNKINQNVTMYNMKDGSAPAPVPVVNAWEKPITSQLRNNVEQDTLLGMGVENCNDLEQTQQSSTSSQRSSPSNDKVLGKTGVGQDKAVLDGTTPPVNTIIFENTNYKSAPVNADLAVKSKFTSHLKTQQRNDKSRSNKLDDNDVESSVMSGFNKPIQDILNKSDSKPDPIQMPLSFNKAEDNADMKLDFTFDSDLSQLTDDKSSKSLGLPRSIHAITSAQSTISPSTAELNLKIASVKKVWETMPTVLEHNVVTEDSVTSSSASFSTSFGPDPNTLDHSNAFSKGTDTPDDNHEGYNSSPSQSCTSNNTTNVCKVKPTQQLAGSGQTVHSVSTHHASSQQHPGATSASQHSAMVSQNLIGHPLSPPPMQQVLGASVGLGQPPQQYTSNQHINYQASLGGNAQYGSMSAIPSPPTVLFNSTQQMPTQGGLYGFQMDQSQAATGPFGQSQQLTNNPSTVLISTTSNSLMSATVKPSSQQISAIGTKAGTVGQAYQQQSQQQQQLYIPYDPNMQANYLSGTSVLQRGPTGPVQNSVVPGLQPSSSYYSGSAGAQTGFYQQPGNSTIQSAPLHQHQTSFGLQGNVFGTHNQSHANAAGLQSFGSQFLSSQMQVAAALTAHQQFRSPNIPNPNYLKGVSTQHMTDQSGRSQQLKSPGANQQDVIASVFNTAPQIPSPKSRQNCKQPPPQSSPTQHKYISAYQSVNNQQSAQIPQTRYPAPIQRPVNFQPALNSSLQSSGNVSNRHRPTHNQNSRGPQRQYYGGQGGGIPPSQTDKTDDSKLNENGPSSAINASNASMISGNSGVSKVGVTVTGNGSGSTNQNCELGKDTVNKDEVIVNKE